jgi:hypothetical protein
MSNRTSVDATFRTPRPAIRVGPGIALLALATLLAAGCDRPGRNKPAVLDGAARFQLLDAGGQPLPAGSAGQHCVLDLATRLVWEIKQVDGLHGSDQTYTWYAGDKPTNMGEPGEQGGGRCILERCDTEQFVAAVNAAGYCGGAGDWRLPSREEVITIGDRRHAEQGLSLDPAHFPNTVPGEHWTGTTFRLYPKTAWAFDTRYALDRADWKTAAKPVRLVRGPLAEQPVAATPARPDPLP